MVVLTPKIAAGISAIIVVGIHILAQNLPAVDASLVSLIGNAGVVGVLIWFLWYHTTTSYPKMLRSFSEEVAGIRETFLKDQKEARDAFVKDQAESRRTFLEEQVASRDYSRNEIAEMRGMLIQALTSMRGAVHDVRDTANAVVQSGAIAKLREKEEGR